MTHSRPPSHAVRRIPLVLVAVVLPILGCAAPDAVDHPSPDPADRVIAVSMTDDLRFAPDDITVAAGERITFEVTNDGATVHEFLVGNAEQQAEFAEEMASGDMHHEGDAGVSVEPGKTERFTYAFEDPGELLAGCHEPGHYEAGMVATITVTD